MGCPPEGSDTPLTATEKLSLLRERTQDHGLPVGTQGVEGLVTSLVVTSAWRILPAHLDPESLPSRKSPEHEGSGLNYRTETLKKGEAREASHTLQEPPP
ncbi:unnamed protein product [Rangifer tarandus platyrhynchus]|uniref:Uncharacterized protein n=2 Tax=Rangifer tarandus platyrhynchus TaxID=3082113 RepID=A0ABN8ZZS9_RANTA|nr:unnamed protein product [Rangifer tarandus platyrhynchus]